MTKFMMLCQKNQLVFDQRKSRRQKKFGLVDVFYLENGLINVRVFYAFAKKKVLVLIMKKGKKNI